MIGHSKLEVAPRCEDLGDAVQQFLPKNKLVIMTAGYFQEG